jgi:hypothetical protein
MQRKLMNFCVKLLGVLLVLVPSVLFSQQAPAVDGASIVQRSLAAMGCAAITKDTTAMLSGSLTLADGTVMPLTMYSQGDSRLRSELDTPKGRKVTIVNEGKGQMQQGGGRVIALAENNTSHQRPTHIPCLTNLDLPPGMAESVVIRSDQLAGDVLDVVEIAPANRPKNKQISDRMNTLFWISRNSGYVVKLQYINTAESDSNDTQPVVVEYFDYRVIDGVAIPFRQVTRAGDLVLDLRFNSVQLNTAAADFTLR